MALVGGMLAALAVGKGDPGFVHNGALACLVAICAGSDVVQPINTKNSPTNTPVSSIARRSAGDSTTHKMERSRCSEVTGGMNIPGMNLPF